MDLGNERQKAFEDLRLALLAPPLTLPDPTKSFCLFMDEKCELPRGYSYSNWDHGSSL